MPVGLIDIDGATVGTPVGRMLVGKYVGFVVGSELGTNVGVGDDTSLGGTDDKKSVGCKLGGDVEDKDVFLCWY